MHNRTIQGAKELVESKSYTSGKIAACGSMQLDGCLAHWILWSGKRPGISPYGPERGFVGVLYDGELYDLSSSAHRYRSFGVGMVEVQRNLWIILQPPAYDKSTHHGVYPRQDRNSLSMAGGPHADGRLPLDDWAIAFATDIPTEIATALKVASKSGGTLRDATWRQRLAEKFGAKWRKMKLRAGAGGAHVEPQHHGYRAKSAKRRVKPRPRIDDDGTTSRKPPKSVGVRPGVRPARQ